MSEKFQDGYKELREILKDENGDEELYNSILNNFGIDLSEMEENLFTKVNLEYTSEDNRELSYAYETDSGLDLYASEEVHLLPFGRALVPTGIRFNIPPFYEIQVRSKSGLAIKQGLMVLNSPGTVDCFSEDMKILTIKGEKTINELNLNDVIFSFNEKTLEIEKDIITNIFNTEEQEIIIFETDNGILEVTPNSEVYTKRGLLLAKDVKENDEIIVFY